MSGLSLDLDKPGAGVDGWGVEKGDPGMELARRTSSDMGRLLLLGGLVSTHSGATDAGCECECGLGDAVRFGRHRDGVGRGHRVLLLYFISIELV